MMQRLDLTDNERAILITALRRLVDLGALSPQTQALKAILERLEPQKRHSPYPILRAPAKRVDAWEHYPIGRQAKMRFSRFAS